MIKVYINNSAMARLKLIIDDELLAIITALAEQLWPGQGLRAVTRFIRDAMRRYLRYCDGRSGH